MQAGDRVLRNFLEWPVSAYGAGCRVTAWHCRNGQTRPAAIMERRARAFPLPADTPDVLPYLGGVGSFPDAVAAMDNWAHRKKERRNWINLSFTVGIGSLAK